jgi:hypothetical protein
MPFPTLKAPFTVNRDELPSKPMKQSVNGPAPAKPGGSPSKGGYLLDANGKRISDGRGGWLLAK